MKELLLAVSRSNWPALAALGLSVVSVLISIFAWVGTRGLHPQIAASSPEETLRSYYSEVYKFDNMSTDGAFWQQNRSEILKTFEIAERREKGSYVLVFSRYSVGSKVFRDGTWLRRIADRWYIVPFLSTYDPKEAEVAENLSWFKDADKAGDDWKKESAKR